MKPESLSTIPVTLANLAEETGFVWSEANLLQTAINCHLSLQAHPNKISPVEVKLYANTSPLTEVSRNVIPWDAAILGETQIQQLLDNGNTYAEFAIEHDTLIHTKLPDTHNPLGYPEGEYWQTKQFTPPIIVTTEMIRVPATVIKKISSGKIAWPIELKQAASATKDKGKQTSLYCIDNWRVIARQIGKEIHSQKPNLNMEQIAKKVHDEMVIRNNNKEPGMTGRGGKIPSAETIKRHALTNIKS